MGNANNYLTYELCIQECGTVCQLPANPGPCLAAIPRWYYNASAGDCLQFTWGGCGGNENNYTTYDACILSCGTSCQYPADSGPCLAAFPRWYYNSSSGHCETFTYGGCGGNANNYLSRTLCMESCGDVCYLPPDSGPCLGLFPRWYYDRNSQSCKRFNYGGCGGNGNNHLTLEACMSSCAPTCKQPSVQGPCLAALSRWYYDDSEGRCLPFTYGGCGANDNNFPTLTACNQRCPCTSTYHDDQYYIASMDEIRSASVSLSSVSVVDQFATLKYSATDEVELSPGFTVQTDGQLEVAMDGCLEE